MKQTYAGALRDEELRSHLKRGDTLAFTDEVKDWQEIEKQVERFGFGDVYAVSRGTKPAATGTRRHTRVSPLRSSMPTGAAQPRPR